MLPDDNFVSVPMNAIEMKLFLEALILLKVDMEKSSAYSETEKRIREILFWRCVHMAESSLIANP